MALGMEVGLGPGHIVLDGTQLRSSEKRQSPQFLTHFYCGQTAACIKMPLGMKVGLSPGDFALDEDPVPSLKSGGDPQFSAHVYCGQTAAWIKTPLGTEVGLGLRDIVLDGDPAFPPLKGHSHPNFRPMSVMAKRLDGLRSHLVRR